VKMASNTSASNTTLASTHACFTPFQPWEEVLTSILCGLVIIISAVDCFLCYTRARYFFVLRERLVTLLSIPGLYAVSVIFAVASTEDYAVSMIADMQNALRAWFLWNVVAHILFVFSMRHEDSSSGIGNLNEAVERVGKTFEMLEAPRQKVVPPPCALLWCSCSYQPGRAFLRSCVARMNLVVYSAAAVLVLRVLLHALGVHSPLQNGATSPWHAANQYLTICGLLMTFLALSCKMPLDKLIEPLILTSPRGRMSEKMRQITFHIIFTVNGSLHRVIALIIISVKPVAGDERGCLWWMHHENLVVAFELLVVAVIGHRAWCPPFVWGLQSRLGEPNFDRIMDAFAESHEATMKEVANAGKFLTLSDDLIKDVVAKEKTPKEAYAANRASKYQNFGADNKGTDGKKLVAETEPREAAVPVTTAI